MTKDPFGDDAAEDFLSGGGVAAKWPKVGHVVEGTITGWSMAQINDYDTGEPAYRIGNKTVPESKLEPHQRATAKPAVQLILEIQGEPTGETWEGNEYSRVELPDDTGERLVYVKGSLQFALKQALRAAGTKLEVGAHISIKREADGPKSNPKYGAPHRHSAVWTPAAQNANAPAVVMGDDNPFA